MWSQRVGHGQLQSLIGPRGGQWTMCALSLSPFKSTQGGPFPFTSAQGWPSLFKSTPLAITVLVPNFGTNHPPYPWDLGNWCSRRPPS